MIMNDKGRNRSYSICRLLVVASGAGVVALATKHVIQAPFDPRWLALAASVVFGTWITTSPIPGVATGAITVSDTFVFLTILLCGPNEAILVAAFATASESARFTKSWTNFATNIAIICTSFYVSSLLVALVFGDVRLLAHSQRSFFTYLLALGFYATAQAVVNHGLIVALVAIKSRKPMLDIWRKNYSWGFVTFFSGMLTAGVVNALIHFYGFWAIAFTVPVLLANYLAYRPYIKNIEAARQHVEETRALHLRTLEAFATAVDAKDQITHEHVQRVQIYAEGMARLLDLPEKEIEALRAGALLHDIGKIAVPDYILNKPGKLTASEFDKMKLHTVVGAQILERIKFPYPLVPIVRYHHERWDGTGYPEGLKGEQIPITARILTVVDCFDAVREDRQYRKGMTRSEAIELLQKDRGKYYDPPLVDLFVENLPVFEAEIAKMRKGQQAFAPVQLEESEAISRATPAAGLAEETNSAREPAEYIRTILAAHQSSREMVDLYEIAQTLTSSLDARDMLALLTSKLERILPFDTCVVYLCDETGGSAVAQHVTGLNAESFRGRSVSSGEGVTGWVIANDRPFANTDPALDLSALGSQAQGYRTLAVHPLVKGEKKLGALALYSQSLTSYSEDQLRTLKEVAGLTSDALHNALLYSETKRDVLTDQLTGLPNARHFYTVFEREQARAAQHEHPLALLTIDVNGFRRVNDTLGRERGDQALREIAELIRAQLRREDLLVRYAGDKFIALLRNTPPERMGEICVRLQMHDALREIVSLGADEASLGVSIGQARLGHDGESLEELLEAADGRLLADKAAQRSLSEFSRIREPQT
jgi:diguanylate cyclase (GGDEF)-like protein/putative nucleotidyltransferase with HDIG domain